MDDEGFLWGEAEVTYPDWVGTAQLDERMTMRGKKRKTGLEAEIGLDADAWRIIGIDIGGGEHQHQLRVIAIPRDTIPEGGGILPKIAERDGAVQATEFLVHDVNPYKMLRAITHVFELRLRWRSAVGVPIRIVARADVPEQDWQD